MKKQIQAAQAVINERTELAARIHRERKALAELREKIPALEGALGDALAAGDDGAEKTARKNLGALEKQIHDAELTIGGLERRLAASETEVLHARDQIEALKRERYRDDRQELSAEFRALFEAAKPLLQRAFGFAAGHGDSARRLDDLARVIAVDPVGNTGQFGRIFEKSKVQGRLVDDRQACEPYRAGREEPTAISKTLYDLRREAEAINRSREQNSIQPSTQSPQSARGHYPQAQPAQAITYNSDTVTIHTAPNGKLLGEYGNLYQRAIEQAATNHTAVQIAASLQLPTFVIESWLASHFRHALPADERVQKVWALYEQQTPLQQIAEQTGFGVDAVRHLVTEHLRRQRLSQAAAA